MPIPTSDRVEYARNTLEEVVCQLRFPPILRIDAPTLAQFQDRIRHEYPLFDEQVQESISLPLPHALSSEVARILGGSKTYQFASEDGTWKVNLAHEWVALTCTEYTRWEVFRYRLQRVLDLLSEEYGPAFFSRVGLRYQNMIVRSDLGLEDVAWSDLLSPSIIGELGCADLVGEVEGTLHDALITLEEFGGKVRVRHGLGTASESGEDSYLIDCDYFTTQRTEVTDALSTLDFFNQRSGRLFRWYIGQRLHEAMEPRVL